MDQPLTRRSTRLSKVSCSTPEKSVEEKIPPTSTRVSSRLKDRTPPKSVNSQAGGISQVVTPKRTRGTPSKVETPKRTRTTLAKVETPKRTRATPAKVETPKRTRATPSKAETPKRTLASPSKYETPKRNNSTKTPPKVSPPKETSYSIRRRTSAASEVSQPDKDLNLSSSYITTRRKTATNHDVSEVKTGDKKSSDDSASTPPPMKMSNTADGITKLSPICDVSEEESSPPVIKKIDEKIQVNEEEKMEVDEEVCSSSKVSIGQTISTESKSANTSLLSDTLSQSDVSIENIQPGDFSRIVVVQRNKPTNVQNVLKEPNQLDNNDDSISVSPDTKQVKKSNSSVRVSGGSMPEEEMFLCISDDESNPENMLLMSLVENLNNEMSQHNNPDIDQTQPSECRIDSTKINSGESCSPASIINVETIPQSPNATISQNSPNRNSKNIQSPGNKSLTPTLKSHSKKETNNSSQVEAEIPSEGSVSGGEVHESSSINKNRSHDDSMSEKVECVSIVSEISVSVNCQTTSPLMNHTSPPPPITSPSPKNNSDTKKEPNLSLVVDESFSETPREVLNVSDYERQESEDNHLMNSKSNLSINDKSVVTDLSSDSFTFEKSLCVTPNSNSLTEAAMTGHNASSENQDMSITIQSAKGEENNCMIASAVLDESGTSSTHNNSYLKENCNSQDEMFEQSPKKTSTATTEGVLSVNHREIPLAEVAPCSKSPKITATQDILPIVTEDKHILSGKVPSDSCSSAEKTKEPVESYFNESSSRTDTMDTTEVLESLDKSETMDTTVAASDLKLLEKSKSIESTLNASLTSTLSSSHSEDASDSSLDSSPSMEKLKRTNTNSMYLPKKRGRELCDEYTPSPKAKKIHVINSKPEEKNNISIVKESNRESSDGNCQDTADEGFSDDRKSLAPVITSSGTFEVFEDSVEHLKVIPAKNTHKPLKKISITAEESSRVSSNGKFKVSIVEDVSEVISDEGNYDYSKSGDCIVTSCGTFNVTKHIKEQSELVKKQMKPKSAGSRSASSETRNHRIKAKEEPTSVIANIYFLPRINALILKSTFDALGFDGIEEINLSNCPMECFEAGEGYGSVTFSSFKALSDAMKKVRTARIDPPLLMVPEITPTTDEMMNWLLKEQDYAIKQLVTRHCKHMK